MRYKRAEYADFIRALTPLVTDLFELIIEKQFKTIINDYCYLKEKNESEYADLNIPPSKRKVRSWDMHKLAGSSLLEILNNSYTGGFKADNVSSEHLLKIICYSTNNENLKCLARKIRLVEMRCRNIAAHEIVSISDTTIAEMTGLTGDMIIKIVKQLFSYTDIKPKEAFWNSYDEMNNMIINLLA